MVRTDGPQVADGSSPGATEARRGRRRPAILWPLEFGTIKADEAVGVQQICTLVRKSPASRSPREAHRSAARPRL